MLKKIPWESQSSIDESDDLFTSGLTYLICDPVVKLTNQFIAQVDQVLIHA